jgi:transketolase
MTNNSNSNVAEKEAVIPCWTGTDMNSLAAASGKSLVWGLKKKANDIRKKSLTLLSRAGKGHLATSFSETDILTALYYHILKIDPSNPRWEERDRFFLSKGHGCEALYPVLADRGFFPEEKLLTYQKFNTTLAAHPNANKLAGIEATTGSLGHGLSLAVGMALGARLDKATYRIITMLGDGENNEGMVWEAAMSAAHYGLDNLTAIIDRNGLQNDGYAKDVMNTEPLKEKWESFGWEVREIDGHDMEQILNVLKAIPFREGKPSMVIAKTVKGKGAPVLENKVGMHYISLSPELTELIFGDLNKIEEELDNERISKS